MLFDAAAELMTHQQARVNELIQEEDNSRDQTVTLPQRNEARERAKVPRARLASGQPDQTLPYLPTYRLPHLATHHLKGLGRSPSARSLVEVWQDDLRDDSDRPSRRSRAWRPRGWFNATFRTPLTEAAMTRLPRGSFAVRFVFTLRHPYLSKGENDLYALDNSVRTDPLFRLPMVAPSSWKGGLRAAMRHARGGDDHDPALQLLFGTSPDESGQGGQAGRLHFYPTFFERVGLEVISPHDRERKIGKPGRSPIPIECVPAGATGWFQLCYIPFDLIELGAANPTELQRRSGISLELVGDALRDLFTVYGFGAKTSSGYGLAEESLHETGTVIMRLPNGTVYSQSFHSFSELPARSVPGRQP